MEEKHKEIGKILEDTLVYHVHKQRKASMLSYSNKGKRTSTLLKTYLAHETQDRGSVAACPQP